MLASVFYAARHGDYLPLIFGCVMVVFGVVFLLDVRGIARHMAQQVVDRFPIYDRLGGVSAGYWIARASGVSGVLVGAAIVLFL